MKYLTFITNQQKEIVLSKAKHKLINGCAGSHKTDTLVKCAIHDITENKRPILFLTLVGSVTIEIKSRLEKYLNISIDKQNNSNHYVGFYEKVPICISNYDAWVHLMLEKQKNIAQIAQCYSKKVNVLLEKINEENISCIMKTKDNVGLLIVDEAQDLRSKKMEILVNLAMKNENMDFYIAGDYLQSLYSDENSAELNCMDAHAMNIFKRISTHEYFDLNICMRSPKAHVDFNNLIMNDIQKKYGLPNMETLDTNEIDKPLLFTHLQISNNTTARINAEQVTSMIEKLIEYDRSIEPRDITIIMGKSFKNEIFNQLQDTLPKMYKSIGKNPDLVTYMNTNGDGRHITLDWVQAEDKTKMLSIHGDKGKGHKVVFLLGLTENSIPKEYHIFTPNEIISESLLNVGITRSTKYLFIGFTRTYPSRYLKAQYERLSEYAYTTWDSNPDCVPEPYRSLINSNSNDSPNWKVKYKNEKINSGEKSELKITDDLSKVFDQAEDFINYDWNKNKKQIVFGTKQEIKTKFGEEQYCILGIMAELLIQRITHREKLFKLLKEKQKEENIIATDNERFLSNMYDVSQYENSVHLELYFHIYRKYFKETPELEEQIRSAFLQGKTVIHSIFRSEAFLNDLNEFLSDKPNNQLRTNCIWNVTLFFNQIKQHVYRPVVNTFFDTFNQDITQLHENIDTFIELYNLKEENVICEIPFEINGTFSDLELKILNRDQYIISLAGRLDMYKSDSDELFEIKASSMDICSQQWIVQILCYALLLDIYNFDKVEKIYIVNILKGCIWEWSLPDLPEFENIIESKISKKYNWHSIETQVMLKKIIEKRNEKAKSKKQKTDNEITICLSQSNSGSISEQIKQIFQTETYNFLF